MSLLLTGFSLRCYSEDYEANVNDANQRKNAKEEKKKNKSDAVAAVAEIQ